MPKVRSSLSMKRVSDSGLSRALLSWNRYDLLADPPPLAMNRNE